MFRHQGKRRTIKQNFQIASTLSLVAGIVNVTGFLEFKQLTTNVTGHFVLFIQDASKSEFWTGTIFLLYILSFLIGSFSSSFLIESYRNNNKINVFFLPTLIELLILLSVPILYAYNILKHPDVVVCSLLFAMGLQNSLVTKISNQVVRTTHFTGLFTDLGIELSQLFFPKNHPNQQKIKSTIYLRIYIISSFFLGGIVGGLLYYKLELGLNTLIFASIILFFSLLFDDIRFRLIQSKRKLKQRKK